MFKTGVWEGGEFCIEWNMQVPHTVSILHKVTVGGSGDGPRMYNALVHQGAF